MSIYLGIDTSNYTTSLSLYNSDTQKMYMQRKLLPVKEGERGLRQSDAVFLHNKALPELMHDLHRDIEQDGIDIKKIRAAGVSSRPVPRGRSYMPCFIPGISFASVISDILGVPLYKFSHQEGHIAAALFSLPQDARDRIGDEFYAFHISGGTSECVNVKYKNDADGLFCGFDIRHIGGTRDLNFGQAVDRTGVRLGLGFPCGREMQALALGSKVVYNPRVSVSGVDFHVSGLENMAMKMLEENKDKRDICRFIFDFISKTLEETVINLGSNKKILFVGGVMSNCIIKENIMNKFPDALFAEPGYSSDNACGTAYLTKLVVEK